jgi:6-pyruvoyltetrahydropterin/6-carboxytetrahydropterin synthase
MFEVSVDETFSAGHALRGYKGKCENPHGHNYKVRLTVQGPQLDSIGLLFDFVHLKQVLHAVINNMDHKYLNDQPPFIELNPSAENIAKYLYDEVARGLKEIAPPAEAPSIDPKNAPRITSVTVWETDITSATYHP